MFSFALKCHVYHCSLSLHLMHAQLGGLNIQSMRNAYGRQINSFEGALKLKEPALFRSDQEAASGGSHQLAPDEFPGIFIRAPGIVKLTSPHVQTLATLEEGGGEAVVAVRQGHILATTFHPELTSDRRWHSYFMDMIIAQKFSI